MLDQYLQQWRLIATQPTTLPWMLTHHAAEMIQLKILELDADFSIRNNIAIHNRARIEEYVVLKGPVIISANCFVAAHAYLRQGVWLGEDVSIGPGCEIKSSFILPNASLAHFNFVGDSIIGSYVNIEAGAIIANHHNEREDKRIDVMIGKDRVSTGIEKFGALIGDYTKIGANAVLSPGTILEKNSVVKRLALIEQI